MILRWLVQTVMQNPPVPAVDTTVSFVRNRQNVRQALYVSNPFLAFILPSHTVTVSFPFPVLVDYSLLLVQEIGIYDHQLLCMPEARISDRG
jgi:hypothetical protein